jgi:hypothetical protein
MNSWIAYRSLQKLTCGGMTTPEYFNKREDILSQIFLLNPCPTLTHAEGMTTRERATLDWT